MRAANEPLSKLQMLELYRVEKEAMDDPLEPFPTFADWKKEYCDEFMSRSHHRKPVDLETLIEETDREVEEAELVLQTDEGDDDMSETKVLSSEEQAKRDAKNARRREQRAAAKASTVTSTTSPKVRAARTGTKAEAAAKIFASMYPDHPRSEIIAKFQSKVGLSPAGSSTYYQKLLSKAKA